MNLPIELILIISDLFLYNDDLIFFEKLNNCFNINVNYDVLRLAVLKKYKSKIEYKPSDRIILWNKTGIDDGVPPRYLLKHFNDNQMYRTFHAHSIIKKGAVYGILSDKSYTKNKRITEIIIKDDRHKPECIFYQCMTHQHFRIKLQYFLESQHDFTK